jgi:VIT1/CCC1 family predicted Fe2+/Mn2+ transporter
MAQRVTGGGTTERQRGPQAALEAPGHEHEHRNVQGGAARAAVFGISDGLTTNVSLILGVAGASSTTGASFVRLAGLAGLVGGAFSMAAGEYVSMRAQTELLERELEVERTEIQRRPESERRELAEIYRQRGVEPDTADELAREMMRDPELALETHAREELGIDPSSLGSPVQAAVSSFLAFGVGAIAPLLPWFFAKGTAAVLVSIAVAAVAAVLIGAALARFTGRSVARSSLRQLFICALAAGVTFGVGKAVGVKGVG